MQTVVDTLFRPEGRISRASYSVLMLCLMTGLLVVVSFSLLSSLFSLMNGGGLSTGPLLVGAVAMALGGWSMEVLTVKRLHDIGLPGLWSVPLALLQVASFLVFAPGMALVGNVLMAVSVLAGMVVAFLPGTDGPNEFGPGPA